MFTDVHESDFFGIMADEYTDLSNKQQVSVCLRWVDSKGLKVYEDLFGSYEVDNMQSTTIVNAIKDVLTRLNLPTSKCRGQTYDGASNMMGKSLLLLRRLKS